MVVASQLKILRIILFIQIISITISNKNILIFNSSHYKSGYAAFTSEGDMIIEYSYQHYRLFYGLKKNGKYYFKENGTNIPTKSLII